MVGETNSMVGYDLMTGGHSIQLGSGGAVPPPPAGPGNCPDNNNHMNINIFGISYVIRSQSNLSLKFLIKWFLIKKQRVYHTYDMKFLNTAGK